MDLKKTAKFIKYLLILQTLTIIGIGICEIIQLAEIDKTQEEYIQHPNDWNYLFGYTTNLLAITMRIYYWLVIFISIGILGWSLDSFEKRWQSIQNYNDNPRNITLLILWCIATIPSVILLSDSSNSRICSSSSYAYKVPSKLLRHCNAYLASLLLAYIFIFSTIIQLLFGFTIVKHQKEISMKPPPISIFQPKKMKVRRSKRVNKKRNSLKSSAAFSNGTRLSIVTEDEEEKTRSTRSGSKNNRSVTSLKHEFSSEMQVNSNV